MSLQIWIAREESERAATATRSKVFPFRKSHTRELKNVSLLIPTLLLVSLIYIRYTVLLELVGLFSPPQPVRTGRGCLSEAAPIYEYNDNI